MLSIRTEQFHSCIICGATGERFYEGLKDYRGIVRGEFNIRYCASCRLLWLDPRPIAEDIKRCYKDFFIEEKSKPHSYNWKNSLLTSFKGLLRKSILCGYFGYRHVHKKHILCKAGAFLGRIPLLRSKATYYLGEFFLPYTKKKDDSLIIDIGCGGGDYLELMKELGWNVLGIETDPAACSMVRKKGVPIFEGIFEEAKLADLSADQITMHHLIEHLPDPQSTIKECFRVLKAGGRLVIHTPNAGSLAHKVFKEQCCIFDSPRHLFLFFPESIRKIFQSSRFNNFYIKTIPPMASNSYYNSIGISKKGKGYVSKVGGHWFALKELLLCYLGEECGEEIEVVAIK